MHKKWLLPVISTVIVLIIIILLQIPSSRDFLTGFAIKNHYYLDGRVEINSPVEIYDSCNIVSELENYKTAEKQINIFTAQEFKENSIKSSDNKNFAYSAQVSYLTKSFIISKGNYILTIRVFCDNNLISETKEAISI